MKAAASFIINVCCLFLLSNVQIGGQEMDAPNGIADPRKFDEYTDLSFPDETARLDNLGVTLKEMPEMVGWYFIFAGSKSCPGEARRRAVRAKNYLVRKRGIRADQIIWSDEGYREELTVEIWVWPRKFGKPGTTNNPTVDKDEVQTGMNCKPNPLKRGRRIKPRGAPNNSFNRTRISTDAVREIEGLSS